MCVIYICLFWQEKERSHSLEMMKEVQVCCNNALSMIIARGYVGEIANDP